MTRNLPGWLRRLYAVFRRPTVTVTAHVAVTAVPDGAVDTEAVARDIIEIAERKIERLDWHIAAIEASKLVDARQ